MYQWFACTVLYENDVCNLYEVVEWRAIKLLQVCVQQQHLPLVT